MVRRRSSKKLAKYEIKEIVMGAGLGALSGMALDVVMFRVFTRAYNTTIPPVMIPNLVYANDAIVYAIGGALAIGGILMGKKTVASFGTAMALAEAGQTIGEQIAQVT